LIRAETLEGAIAMEQAISRELGTRRVVGRREKKRRFPKPTRLLLYTALSIWAFLSLLPLYWMFTTALKPPSVVLAMPPEMIPSHVTLQNFFTLVKNTLVFRWTLNSVIVTVAQTAGYLFTSTLAGYAFAWKRFPGRDILFWFLMATMMIPGFVILVTRYTLVSDLNMVNKFSGLILPEIAGPMGVFMMRQFMQSLPSELFDAARIDGCSEWGTFWRVVFPLSLPGIAVLGVFSFIYSWNDFIWPLVVTTSTDMRTLPVGVASLQHYQSTNFSLLMAGASYGALPIMIVFFFAQRYFLKGITIGALKG
jgi:multiple sugar transport system permease protein